MKKLYQILCLFLCLSSSITAQDLTIQTTVPNSLTVCGAADTFDITLTNISTNTLTNIEVHIRLPIGMNYVAGSIMGAATEVDITQLDSIVLGVNDLSSGGMVSFSILANALCEVSSNAGLLNNQIEVLFDTGIETHTTNNYNVDFGSLVVVSYTQDNYTGVLGDEFERCMRIRNSGLGTITQFEWLYRYDPTFLVIDSFRVEGANTTPMSSNDSIWLTIGAGILAGVGNGDAFFDPNEEIEICYRVSVDDCQGGNTVDTTRISYGCGITSCSSTERLGSVAITSDIPSVSASPTYIQNTCNADTAGHSSYIVFTNNGTGPARDLTINVLQSASGAFYNTMISRYDETAVYWKNASTGAIDTLTPISVQYNDDTGDYACLGANPVGAMELLIPLMEAGESDTLFLTQFVCCIERCEEDLALGAYYNFSYSTECFQNSFSEPTQRLRPYIFNRLGSITYDGPTDIVDGDTYSFALAHSSHLWFPQAAGNYEEIALVMPSGLSFSGGLNDIQWVYIDGTIVNPNSFSISGDTLWATFGSRLLGEKSEFRISLDIDCAAGVNNPSQLEYFLYNIPDPTCDCRYIRGCTDFDVTIHCPDSIICVDGGMLPLGFEARRLNYGLPDNDNNGLPDATGSIDMELVRTNYVGFGDTLQAIIHGVVTTSGTNPNWSYGYADFDMTYGDRFTEIGADVRVVDVSTGMEYTCSLGAPVRADAGSSSSFLYDFSVGSTSGCLPMGFVYEAGDTVELTARYKYSDLPYSNFTIQNIASDFYMSDAPNGSIFTCDEYRAAFGVIGYFFNSASPNNFSINGCGNLVTNQNYYLSIGGCCTNYAGGNLFRYEYRPWALPDTFEIIRPTGYEWVSSQVNFQRTAGTVSTFTYPFESITPIDAEADTLVFEVKNLFEAYGGSWVMSDDGFLGIFEIEWRPTCDVPSQQLLPIRYIWNFETVDQWNIPTALPPIRIQDDQVFYAGPGMDITGVQTATGLLNTVSWELTLTNNSNESDADNAWLLPVSNGGVEVVEVFDVSTQTVVPLNDVYELGSFASGGASKTVRITATYASCDLDSMMIYSGWNCSGYPTSATDFACTPDSIALYVDPEGSELQVQLTAPNGTQKDLCDSIPFVLSLSSTQLAAVDDIIIDIVTPSSGGLSMVADSSLVRYPSSAASLSIANPTQAGNIYTWYVDSLQAYVGENGLPGTLTSGDSNSIDIQFLLRTDCDFISGTSFYARIRSKRACDQDLPVLFRTSPPITINGATATYQTDMNLQFPDTVSGCNGETLMIEMVNLGPSMTTTGDQIQVALPDGMSYVGNLQGSLNAPSGTPSTQALVEGTMLGWEIPAGLGIGDTVRFSFEVQADAGAACAETAIAAYSVSDVSLDCHGVNCTDAYTQTGFATTVFDLNFPSISVDLVDAAWIAAGGTNASVNYELSVQHIDGPAIGAMDTILFALYSDVDASGDVDGGDAFLTTFMMTSPLGIGQSISLLDTITVDTNSLGQHSLLLVQASNTGANPACICNTTVDTITTEFLCSVDTVICPNDTMVDVDAGMCSRAVTLGIPSLGTCTLVTLTNDFNGTSDASGIYDGGTTTVTFTATDAASNTATCSFDVTVNDTEAPTISCPSDITQNNDAGTCEAVVTVPDPTASDNCPNLTLSNSFNSTSNASDTYSMGTSTVTFIATDQGGNTASCSFVVTINDTEAPTITCPTDITQSNDLNQCTAAVTVPAPTASDNCLGITLVNDMNATSDASDTYPVGTTTVTFTVTDAASHTASCSFDVTVNDTEAPSITCPPDVTSNNDAGMCTAAITAAAPTSSDNCPSATLTNDFNGSTDASDTYPIGTTTVTFTITDAASNTATCAFGVTVNDNEAPSISCPADVTANNDAGMCTAAITVAAPTTSDNCPSMTFTNDFNGSTDASDTYPVGTTTVTFTITDAASNTATCSFDVTVNDNEAPSISCPADVTANNDAGMCTAAITAAAPTTSDNCPSSTLTNDFNGSTDASDTYPVGTTTVTFTITDVASNTATCSFDVTVNDNEAPSISCPADVTANNDAGMCTAAITAAAPTTSDNCPSTTLTNDFNGNTDASDTYPVGTTTVAFTITDAASNTATCVFDVTVNDNEAPSIGCPADVTSNNDAGMCTAAITAAAPTTSDNCPSTTLTNDFNGSTDASDTYPVGTTTVTFTITDAASNTATCSFDVTVNDNEAPSISCPADVTSNNDAGMCTAVITAATLTSSDNCPSTTFTNDFNGTTDASDTYPVGTTTVTFTITDAASNTATCSFDVTVNDNEAPSISCPADVTANNDAGMCTAALTAAAPTTSDNCPSTTLTNDFNGSTDASDTYPVGTTTVTFTITDAASNTATCSFDVTVNDNEAPSISCPADVTANNDAGMCTAAITAAAPTTSDNCPSPTFTNDFNGTTDASDTYPVGTTTVTFTITDAASNTATCSFDVTVNDNEVPSISCPADITASVNSADCDSAIIGSTLAIATDNCPIAGFSNSYNGGVDAAGTYPIGTTTVVWTVSDAAGQSATCSIDIVVTDMQLTVSNDTTICGGNAVDLNGSVIGGSGSYTYTWSDGSSIVGSSASVTVVPSATTTYTLIVDDGQCVDSASFVVTVETSATNPMACPDCWNSNFEYAPLGMTTVAPMYCDSANWTHYYDPANPSDLLFSIEHHPAVAGGNTNPFTVEVLITATTNPVDSMNFNSSTIWAAEDMTNKELNLIMGRYWNVNLLSGSLNGTVNVRFYYRPEERQAIEGAARQWMQAHNNQPDALSMGDLIWFKTRTTNFTPTIGNPDPYQGSVTPVGIDDHLVLMAAGYGSANNRNYVQFDGITSFSGGTAAIRVSPFTPILPLELLQFTAHQQNESVALQWLSVESPDLVSYEVERSSQNGSFEVLGNMMAIGAEGEAQSYAFLDERPATGLNRYRLKGVFADGSVEYSSIEEVYVEGGMNFHVYPNPFHTSLFVEWKGATEGEVRLSLYNALGQLMAEKVWQQSNAHTEEIDLSELPEGVYLYKIWHEGKVVEGSVIRMD